MFLFVIIVHLQSNQDCFSFQKLLYAGFTLYQVIFTDTNKNLAEVL